jgi:hypothetical protein
MKKSNNLIGTDKKAVLFSTIWLVAVLNYIYNDVFSVHFNPVLQKAFYEKFLTGVIGNFQISEVFVLVGAVLMETAILMVLLSRILPYHVNRILNIVVAFLHTISVIASLFAGTTPSMFYIFFAGVEIILTISIIVFAIQWKQEIQPVISK